MLQSIYTHAGCDEIGHPVWTLFDVSIHTPTQGVTQPPQAVEATHRFQSTHPRRVWLRREIKLSVSPVSIHTPTQGVTFFEMLYNRLNDVSIHTPTQGVTILDNRFIKHLGFNPHTHAGCDYDKNFAEMDIESFNPHTHAGCD